MYSTQKVSHQKSYESFNHIYGINGNENSKTCRVEVSTKNN